MSQYIIEGGQRLSGTVKISGNKNSVFPCLAAALLTKEEVVLKNVPNIVDTQVSLEILQSLGVVVNWDKESKTITLKTEKLTSSSLPEELTQKLRGSVVFAGGVLGRMGKVDFYHPGGDAIGKRSIDVHLEGFRQLGFDYQQDDLHYSIKGTPNDAELFFEEASPTGTENLVLASVLGGSKAVIKNCAKEPHVVDLCLMLNKMGAKIKGVGESTLVITGVKSLRGVEFMLGLDYLELGTYAIAAAITGGEVECQSESFTDLEPVLNHLSRFGLNLKVNGSTLIASADELKGLDSKLHTNIWPGFPSDLMSVAIVLATQAKGTTLLHDWMYESRMYFVDKLISMGAKIVIADPHRVIVTGPSKLHGRVMETPDIRAGMALVLAALVAKGESTINRAELIERGYEDVVLKLTTLGAKINRLD